MGMLIGHCSHLCRFLLHSIKYEMLPLYPQIPFQLFSPYSSVEMYSVFEERASLLLTHASLI